VSIAYWDLVVSVILKKYINTNVNSLFFLQILPHAAVDAALVLSSLMEMSEKAQYTMVQTALLENWMISVKIILEYGQLESEAPLVYLYV
jgi:hypothetical protein